MCIKEMWKRKRWVECECKMRRYERRKKRDGLKGVIDTPLNSYYTASYVNQNCSKGTDALGLINYISSH